ncbi:MAG: DNA replication/repair protein RecF [Spongiibacteraceae bacterium]
MLLTRLQVRNIRNLKQASLNTLRPINVLFGVNGSGKTSLLEALHLLLAGRPFRGAQLRPVLSEGADECTVFTEINEDSTRHSLGMQRTKADKPTIKLNGERLQTLSELVRIIPVQVLNAEAFSLLTGGPGERREFMDWGLFHVEPSFHPAWQQARRALLQRNALIRHGKIDRPQLLLWSQEYARYGAQLDQLRHDYVGALAPLFRQVLSELNPALVERVVLTYARGWPREQDLAQLLVEGVERDIQHGFTRLGPHRADLRVQVGGAGAADMLSRGQLKLTVASLRIAQARLLLERSGRHCLFLVDDLPAELDSQHRRQLCHSLEEIGAQIFVTCIEPGDLADCWQHGDHIAMFHVEHGVITPGSIR